MTSFQATRYPTSTCEDSCPICLENLNEGECRVVPCGHHFHTSCLQAMFDTSSTPVPQCGVCRRDIQDPIDYSATPRFTAMLNRVNGEHKAYQFSGVRWCVEQERQNIGGALLADEMGLGKTYTLIGTMLENFKRNTLIVVPLALLDQWKEQLFKLTGHNALVFHGAERKNLTEAHLLNAPVVLTTYNQVAIPLQQHGDDSVLPLKLIHKVSWDRIIYDEAHNLRNPRTGKYRGADKMSATFRWFVTGTPIQNCKRDLLALALLANVPPRELVQHHMLRRTKTSVGLPLPSLNLHTEVVSWESEQERRLAEDIHSELPYMGCKNIRSDFGGVFSEHLARARILALTRAKQMCTIPASMGEEVVRMIEDGVVSPTHEGVSGALGKSKLNAVVQKVLSRASVPSKKLIFCTYHREMDYIKSKLTYEGLEVGVQDGRKTQRRPHSELDVLILQVQTCSEGLNLQEFSEVYFVTPHWNPFVELQAIARCHRLGQTRAVEVFRFYMSGHEFQTSDNDDEINEPAQTFDDVVMQRQEDKVMLSRMALEGVRA